MTRKADEQMLICIVLINAGLFLWPDSAMAVLLTRLVMASMWFIIVANQAEFGQPGQIVERVSRFGGPLLFAACLIMARVGLGGWTQTAVAFGGAAFGLTAAGLYRQRIAGSVSSSAAVWMMVVGSFAGIAAASVDGPSSIQAGMFTAAIAIVLLGLVLARRRTVVIH